MVLEKKLKFQEVPSREVLKKNTQRRKGDDPHEEGRSGHGVVCL